LEHSSHSSPQLRIGPDGPGSAISFAGFDLQAEFFHVGDIDGEGLRTGIGLLIFDGPEFLAIT
jgi:hypothetical protein